MRPVPVVFLLIALADQLSAGMHKILLEQLCVRDAQIYLL